MGIAHLGVKSYLWSQKPKSNHAADAVMIDINKVEPNREQPRKKFDEDALIELQKRKQTIVSCGGGVVMREENADHMKKNGRVVLLTAKPETIYERVKNSDERPILNGNMNVEYISGLMEKRKERYEAVADVTVATDGKNVTQICEEIIAKLIALDNEQDNKQA